MSGNAVSNISWSTQFPVKIDKDFKFLKGRSKAQNIEVI